MPTGSCSIPSFNPATGRISTKSLSRSRRSSRRALFSRFCGGAFGLRPSDQAYFNAQRSTLNAQRSTGPIRIERWTLSASPARTVERWALLPFWGRVKGAWWPPRSSKPSSVGNGRDRFDSYPLRPTRGLRFDGRCLIKRPASPTPQTSKIKPQTSKRG